MKKYIDTHAHVFRDSYNDQLNEIIKKTLETNKKTINIGCDLKTINEVLKLNEKYKELIPAIGLHPTEFNFKSDIEVDKLIKEFEEVVNNNYSKIVSIGEIGLDFYHEDKFKKQQIKGLEKQIEIAKKWSKPVIIHVRDAINDFYPYLIKNSDIKFLIHSWSGDIEQTKKYNSLKNVYFGINGIITFKNSNLKENLKFMDLNKILVETDSPWLSPVPLRGKVNIPSNVEYVYKFLINELEINENEFIEMIERNYIDFFER